MGTYKTPGVYIVEKNAFPNSVVEAPTAIPAFIGITEIARDGSDNLNGKPWKISSMAEYITYFGGAPKPVFILSVTDKKDGGNLRVSDREQKNTLNAVLQGNLHTLYYHMVMFFANGGGTCYLVSVGNYEQSFAKAYADHKKTVFSNLEKEQDITLLVAPEAVNASTCMDIYADMLAHCAEKNRFAILDVPSPGEGAVHKFRDAIGSNHLSFGAAYYPWLETSVLADNDITGEIFTWDGSDEKTAPALSLYCTDQFPPDELSRAKNDLHHFLMQGCPEYGQLVKKVKDYLNLLPPSATMAGIYTRVDHTRGVWKAPANVSVSQVNKPSELIDDRTQEELNVPIDGKSVNAIRYFTGEGVKVWGARTLDGNSLDWRYINVRRAMNFIELSVKNAAKAYVFEPNDASTWINMKCMIENFLRGIWKRGGLAGATPEDAYSVHVGLGDTMTPEDILEGIMRVTVLVAPSRPAEFIEITFRQQMQKS